MWYNELTLSLILISIYYYICEIIPTYNLKVFFDEGFTEGLWMTGDDWVGMSAQISLKHARMIVPKVRVWGWGHNGEGEGVTVRAQRYKGECENMMRTRSWRRGHNGEGEIMMARFKAVDNRKGESMRTTRWWRGYEGEDMTLREGWDEGET